MLKFKINNGSSFSRAQKLVFSDSGTIFADNFFYRNKIFYLMVFIFNILIIGHI